MAREWRSADSPLQITRVASEEVATVLGVSASPPAATEDFTYDVLNRPVRRVVTRSSKSRKGYLSSPKNDAMVAWESPLERDALRLLETDASVSAYWMQPFTMKFIESGSGRWRQHTPDILVIRFGRPVIIEVKDARRAANDAVAQRLTIVREVLAERGLEYRVWTQDLIRQEPRLGNAIWLLRYRSEEVGAHEHLLARRFLEDHGSLRLSDLVQRLVAQGVSSDRLIQKIQALALRGHLRLAMDESVTTDPLLQLP